MTYPKEGGGYQSTLLCKTSTCSGIQRWGKREKRFFLEEKHSCHCIGIFSYDRENFRPSIYLFSLKQELCVLKEVRKRFLFGQWYNMETLQINLRELLKKPVSRVATMTKSQSKMTWIFYWKANKDWSRIIPSQYSVKCIAYVIQNSDICMDLDPDNILYMYNNHRTALHQVSHVWPSQEFASDWY